MGRGLLLLILAACSGPAVDDAVDPQALTPREISLMRQMWPLPAVPPDPTNRVADDPWAAQLGQALFFEPRLSSSGAFSCATCHDPQLGWSDGLRLSEAAGTTDLHAPSVVNAGYNRWHFWDGRCDTQWCQALGPIEAPHEMAGSRLEVVHLIAGDPALREAWEATFGALPPLPSERFPAQGRPVPDDPDHPHHAAWTSMSRDDHDVVNALFSDAGKAIAAFQRRLVSRGSAWDRFADEVLVDGDLSSTALSPSARRGLKAFLGPGECVACHSGPGFTNGEFHNVGLGPRDWLPGGNTGRRQGVSRVLASPFNGTGLYSDDPEHGAKKLDHLTVTGELDGQFKTPTLRDVALTPPYFHGGHAETLHDAVRHYADPTTERPEVGHREDLLVFVTLDDEQISDLVAFLEALTGEPLDPALTAAPESPLYEP